MDQLTVFGRMPPAIIPTGPAENPLQWAFSVDLRDYPDTDRITWDFDDGARAVDLSVSRGRTIVHDFVGEGTFEVTAYLFSAPDPFGGGAELIAVGSLPVAVTGPNAPPVASFVVEDVFDEDGLPVPLTKRFDASRSRDPDPGGIIETYTWDFGDGAHEEGEIVEHTFSRGAEFVVRLTVVDDRGARDSTTRTILINTLPVASFTYVQDPVDMLTFSFDASGSSDAEGAIARYRWDLGDGSATRTGVTISHTYAVPDDYTVVLTVTDETGAAASVSRVLDVTGSEPFVRSISPSLGEIGQQIPNVVIDGENFESGAVVRLERGSAAIEADSVEVESGTTIRLTLDLGGAEAGDYDVVVVNPGGITAQLAEGFKVITPNLVRLTTSFGDILLELVDDAPITTANFLQYVEDGFYDGTLFHRVVPDFVIQGGGLLPGLIRKEGVRDPIVNEFSPERSNIRGTVAMAKLGGDPDSATAQFFINLADNPDLDSQNGGFTVFARVIQGMDVVDTIGAVPVDGPNPIDDVLIIRVERE
jgi:cyclophilin family peptidyl-prolyl cis-trans isomerase/PKD repeat protein